MWWKDQQHGGFYPELRETNHLITGHYHHPAFRQETSGRMLYVCPSLTRNSVWFGDARGIVSSQGTLTMVINDDTGVDLIRVI
jgi:UDP-2,3-diacylglucosamine pyrophosphatase LpxH